MRSYNCGLVTRSSWPLRKMSLSTTAESSFSCTSEAPELSTSTSSGSVLSADSDAASVRTRESTGASSDPEAED